MQFQMAWGTWSSDRKECSFFSFGIHFFFCHLVNIAWDLEHFIFFSSGYIPHLNTKALFKKTKIKNPCKQAELVSILETIELTQLVSFFLKLPF